MRECDHGEDRDDPGFACPPCQAVLTAKAPAVEEIPARSRPFELRWGRDCPVCGRAMLSGEEVVFIEDDQIVHVDHTSMRGLHGPA